MLSRLSTDPVKGEGFAVDASVIEADASRYHGKAPDEIDWSLPERQTRAVAEFLTALDDDDATADRKLPKVIIHACSNHRLKKLVADSLSAAPPAIPR